MRLSCNSDIYAEITVLCLNRDKFIATRNTWQMYRLADEKHNMETEIIKCTEKSWISFSL